MAPDVARLVVSCDDRPRVRAGAPAFLSPRAENIIASEHYSSDPAGGRFYLRVEFRLRDIVESREAFEAAFTREGAEPLGLEWRLTCAADRKWCAVLVSRYDHCLVDLFWRARHGDIEADVALVISNHDDLRDEVERLGVTYHHVPVTRATKPEAEAAMLAVLEGVDFVVL